MNSRDRLLAALAAALAGISQNGFGLERQREILEDWLTEMRREGLITNREHVCLARAVEDMLAGRVRGRSYPEMARRALAACWG